MKTMASNERVFARQKQERPSVWKKDAKKKRWQHKGLTPKNFALKFVALIGQPYLGLHLTQQLIMWFVQTGFKATSLTY